MASFQLLKPNPSYYSHLKLGISSVKRIQSSNIAFGCRTFRISCKDEDHTNQSSGEESPESLFTKELRRRGMKPGSLLDEKDTSSKRRDDVKFMEEDGGWIYSRTKGVRTGAEINLTNQREKSMTLNGDGLEGLIPRAKLLLALGGTFFLAFWPLILATVAFISALYLYFGPEFVHDGSTSPISAPQYVDPTA